MEVGAHGFSRLELLAMRTHLDYHNPAVVADLQQWLAEARLELHSVRAALTEGDARLGGRPQSGAGATFTLASPDAADRRLAIGEAERALHIARRIPFRVLVVHLGLPRGPQSVPGQNSRDAARRSVEELYLRAEPLGVTLAIEILANELSAPASLVHFVDELLDTAPVGICLDFGHAHLHGDLVETIETVSEHLVAAHVHDNRGRRDEHLLPFEGSIDWPGALTALQKVGYDGVIVFEVDGGSDTGVLRRAGRVRQRMEGLLAA